MINFPTSLDSLTNPIGTDSMSVVSHAGQHTNANDAIEALEAKVGADGSAVTTSHDYKLSGVTGSDKAVSKTGTETLTNKTLTSPQVNFTSDATGDLIFRNGSGVTARLPIGSTDQILAVQAGLPTWIANPSAANASYSTKGIVQGLTDEATSGLTIASGVISVNTGTTANKIVKLNGSAQLPAIDGSLLTNLATPTLKAGATTRDLSTASGNQTIAHGLGRTPKMVRITVIQASTSGASDNYSFGMYDGTTNSGVYRGQNSNSQYFVGNSSTYCVNIMTAATNDTSPSTASATVDGTNITLAWTKATSASGTAYILWEVI